MAKIVILGADGFIGRHLVAKLAQDTLNQITAFGKFSNYKKSDEHPFAQYNNVEILPGDFSNRTDVEAALRNAGYVFHLISTTTPATSDKDPSVDVETNVKYSIELLELCVEANVKKIIFPSSGGTIYGDIDSEAIGESVAPNPRSPYGIGKLTIEHYLRYFKFNHGLDYIVYRIANPYGPGQNIHGKQGVIPIFMNKIINNEPLIIYGDGSMVRDYLYIDDLVEMIINTFKLDNKNNEYNIGSGVGTSLNSLIQELERCTGKKLEKKFVKQPSSFVQKSVLDTSRFTEEFNIKPKTSLDVGLRETWDYVKELS